MCLCPYSRMLQSTDGLSHIRGTRQAILEQVFYEASGVLRGADSALNLAVRQSGDLELRRIVESWISSSEVYVIGHKAHDCSVS